MQFLKDVSKEMSKVSWLSKKEVRDQFLAIHVLGFIILFYFFGIDLIVNLIKNLF